MSVRPAAGGGRWIDVDPRRFPGWLDRFAARHGAPPGELRPELGAETVDYAAPDGASATCHVPFPPPEDAEPAGVAAAALRPRLVGVLLVRLGGYAVGVFRGDQLIASKVGSRPVHGRSAAGGRSQPRFARRREKQAREATEAAAATAVAVLLPYMDQVSAVVTGGDRGRIAALREDRRLEPVFARAVPRFLTVPDPRFAVLAATPGQFQAIRVRVREPAAGPVGEPPAG